MMKLANVLGMPVAHDVDVQKMSCDSRRLDAQTWWLAAKGVTHHALDFFDGTQQMAGVVYEPPYDGAHSSWIAYPQLSAHIGEIADRFYGHPSRQLQVLGVTGTDGKSSFVHMMAQIEQTAMIGTIGIGCLGQLREASHTTPDALSIHALLAEYVAQGVRRVAMEVSSHALDQHRVGGVAFDIAVFTNLSRDHLDYHHTMEAYFLTKAKLFAMPLRHAVVNVDDAYGRRLITEHRIYRDAEIWGVSSRGAEPVGCHHFVSADEIVLRHDGIEMRLCYAGRSLKVVSRLLGRFNVDNLLNVAAALLALGYSLDEVADMLTRLDGVPGRVERLPVSDKRVAIVDYAHTPAALENAIKGVRPHIDGHLWVIFGCGGDRDRGKRPMMGKVAEQYADHVVVTDDNPRHESPDEIVRDILQGMAQPHHVQVIRPRAEAIRFVLTQLRAGDAVLIAGKGHEAYQIFADERVEYRDQDVVRSWVAAQCS